MTRITRLSPSVFAAVRSDTPADAIAAPQEHMADVFSHTEFDIYAIAAQTEITINHALVAGITQSLPYGGVLYRAGQVVRTTHNLLAHGQGYPPRFRILIDDEVLASGSFIQKVGSTKARFVTFSADDTHIKITDTGISDASDLAAIPKTYTVRAFRAPEAVDGQPQFRATPSRIIAARAKLDTNEKHARVATEGESPFYELAGPMMDCRSGGFRTVTAKGTIISETAYSGSFEGSPAIQVVL